MENFNLPPVFKDFSTGINTDNKARVASNKTLAVSAPSNGDDLNLKKKNQHTLAKVITGVAVAAVAFSMIVPAIRHKKFAQVNPNMVDISKDAGKFKKGFIEFSDNLEVRRDMLIKYAKSRCAKFRDMIKRNFFSYNQKTPQKLTLIKDIPNTFVRSVLKEINEFVNLCHKFSNKIDIDYTNFTKSL